MEILKNNQKNYEVKSFLLSIICVIFFQINK